MEERITIDDPKNYTRMFSFRVNLRLLPDTDVSRYGLHRRRKGRSAPEREAGHSVICRAHRAPAGGVREVYPEDNHNEGR
jgi:hypothetical protein